jgi:two-component system, NtrC family, nitrogen regulation response regulator NtrX
MRRGRVLIVDDEPAIRESLKGVLQDEGYEVECAGDGESCASLVREQAFDVVLLDVWLPGIDGMETLQRIASIPEPDRPVTIMISGHGTIETAVRATKLGAFDFVEKPLTIQKVSVMVKNAVEHRRLRREVEQFKDSAEKVTIIGESVPMKALRQQMALMAATNGRVLIFGESGTGKELVAHAIHRMSPRGTEPFVEVNCAAIPEELIESELFGHRKGSFHGASDDKVGKLRKADGGTLFLDEVGDMPMATQIKLLRVLEDHTITRVGDNKPIRVNVRIVAATNKNLDDEIARGNFREDLFYRLNVIPFYVPPLRERVEDIPLLADHFLREFATTYGRKPKELTAEAYRLLQDYPWPGNVRELKNLMERIVILNPQVRIDARHIPLPVSRKNLERPVERFGSLQEVREAAERDYILRKLDEAQGNITRAAELVGLERSNLYRKMKSLGIAPRDGG